MLSSRLVSTEHARPITDQVGSANRFQVIGSRSVRVKRRIYPCPDLGRGGQMTVVGCKAHYKVGHLGAAEGLPGLIKAKQDRSGCCQRLIQAGGMQVARIGYSGGEGPIAIPSVVLVAHGVVGPADRFLHAGQNALPVTKVIKNLTFVSVILS